MSELNISENLSAKKLYNLYKKDKIKNANIIIDLLKELEFDDVKKLKKTLAVIHQIFCLLIKYGDLKEPSPKEKGDSSCPKIKYKVWLYERYSELYEDLLKKICDEKIPRHLQEMCFLITLKFIKKETIYHTPQTIFANIHFPLERLKLLYETLLFSKTTSAPFIKKLNEYLQCPDFLFVSLHVLNEIVSQVQEENVSPFFLKNMICFLELITLPEKGKKPLDSPVYFTSDEKESKGEYEKSAKPKFNFSEKKGRKLFNAIWEVILRLKFDDAVYKRCLVLLPQKVMMHLDQPVRLTDFFMNAYSLGGIVSILALHGMYILITQHNLENSDFYDKLYVLFENKIFHAKYKARFFLLCDIFFRSLYLPEYIVAAFIKRSSRLMLTAPSSCLVLLMKFIVNLLMRYPSLKRLIDNPNATKVEDDPFLADEVKPLLCRAGESSLWEITAFLNHPLPGVAKTATFIYKNMPDVEHDLSNHVNVTYERMYDRAKGIKMARTAATFYEPESLFKYSDDTMSESWETF